ncbi:hypothetical protein BBJ28_00015897 [Nothophytophthora sp. Chile5]|nr:hypothetical protein BBJ28_00015897 [Nothophytophthora sp. Chile5]
MGLNLSVARLGSVINNELSPRIAEAANVSTALWAGVLMCAFSGVSVLLVIAVDNRAKQQLPASARKAEDAVAQSIKLSDVKEFRMSFWLLALSAMVIYGCVVPFNSVASSLLIERDYFKTPPSECIRCGQGVYEGNTNCDAIDLDQCPSSPPFAWPLPMLSANCSIDIPTDQWACFVSASSSTLIDKTKINCDDSAWKNGPFTTIYCDKKAEAEARAATPMSIPYLISAIISPFLGLLVDRIGLRAFFLLLAPVTLVVAHTMLAASTLTPFVPLTLLGVAYSVYAAVLWPACPLVVEEHHIGTAYGVVTAAMVNTRDAASYFC